MQLEMSLGRGAEQHRTELVSAQASLTDLHTQLESQEQAVKDTLAGLESTLARIEEQTKALNVMRGNLDSVSVFASAQLQETTRIRNCLAEDSKRLSVEIENFNVSQESTSKLLSSAIDKISKIEKITEKLEARGRRTEMAAVLAAGSVFALLAKNILTLSKVS
jgi:DNA repair exonuclease SbcCD ATPase subunit